MIIILIIVKIWILKWNALSPANINKTSVLIFIMINIMVVATKHELEFTLYCVTVIMVTNNYMYIYDYNFFLGLKTFILKFEVAIVLTSSIFTPQYINWVNHSNYLQRNEYE